MTMTRMLELMHKISSMLDEENVPDNHRERIFRLMAVQQLSGQIESSGNETNSSLANNIAPLPDKLFGGKDE